MYAIIVSGQFIFENCFDVLITTLNYFFFFLESEK